MAVIHGIFAVFLQFPNAVVLSGRKQNGANARAQKSAKGRKRAQKGAKERKQPSLGTPKFFGSYILKKGCARHPSMPKSRFAALRSRLSFPATGPPDLGTDFFECIIDFDTFLKGFRRVLEGETGTRTL